MFMKAKEYLRAVFKYFKNMSDFTFSLELLRRKIRLRMFTRPCVLSSKHVT